MATVGFFDWSGARAVPYIGGANPKLASGDKHVLETNWANAKNCATCLRVTLGCGNAASYEDNQRCRKVAEAVAGGVTGGCNELRSGVISPFDAKAVAACDSVCSREIQLEFGAGYARPYRSNDIEILRGEGTSNPL